MEPAVGTAEVARRSWALEPAHRAVAAFNTAMILLQSVVEILAVAMPNTGAQDRPDRAGITVMPIRGDPIGRDAGDHLGRLEECLRGGHVAVLAEHHVDQRAGAIDGTIEVTPLPVDLDSWLQVSGTTKMPEIDHGVGHQLHTVMALLFELKAQQQPFEFILSREGPLHA